MYAMKIKNTLVKACFFVDIKEKLPPPRGTRLVILRARASSLDRRRQGIRLCYLTLPIK